MNPIQQQAFDHEIALAKQRIAHREWSQSIYHLERAHVIGQLHVWPHVKAHALMLSVEMRRRRINAAFGQFIRIILGAVGSAIGVVPTGNTGGSDVNMFARLPIPPDIQRVLDNDNAQSK